MADNRLAGLTSDQRDALKWVGSTVLGTMIAAAGAATIARLGNVTSGTAWILPTALLVVALGLIVLASLQIGWALAAREPRLTDLAAASPAKTSDARGLWRPRDRTIYEALTEAGAETELKTGGLAAMAMRAQGLDQVRADTLVEVNAGGAQPSTHKRLKDTETKLDALYPDLAEASSAVRYVWVRDRVRWTLSVLGVCATITLGLIIAVVLLTAPTTSPTDKAPVAVRTYFTATPTVATSPGGCTPAPIDTAWMVGGTWAQPMLVFEPRASAITGVATTMPRSGTCDGNQLAWRWQAAPGQVILAPAG